MQATRLLGVPGELRHPGLGELLGLDTNMHPKPGCAHSFIYDRVPPFLSYTELGEV